MSFRSFQITQTQANQTKYTREHLDLALIKMINNNIMIRRVNTRPVSNQMPKLTKQGATQKKMILCFLKTATSHTHLEQWRLMLLFNVKQAILN